MTNIATVQAKQDSLDAQDLAVLLEHALIKCQATDDVRVEYNDSDDIAVIEVDTADGSFIKIIAVVVQVDEFPQALRATEKGRKWGGF